MTFPALGCLDAIWAGNDPFAGGDGGYVEGLGMVTAMGLLFPRPTAFPAGWLQSVPVSPVAQLCVWARFTASL